jgi:hypothetical protein
MRPSYIGHLRECRVREFLELVFKKVGTNQVIHRFTHALAAFEVQPALRPGYSQLPAMMS